MLSWVAADLHLVLMWVSPSAAICEVVADAARGEVMFGVLIMALCSGPRGDESGL